MQDIKRLRIFAGPNGSGKSTLFEGFKRRYAPGYFINADELEKQLNNSGLIDLQDFDIKATEKDLISFKRLKESQSLISKALSNGHTINIAIKENFIVDKAKDTHSYEASFVASFIRWLLYKNNKSFSYETVMSHPSKIKEIISAKKKGYKIYLYFICTEDAEININRITNRIEKGGHAVSNSKIKSRYFKTLDNLFSAVKLAHRAYLFDNSGKKIELIAEAFEGRVQLKVEHPVQWFVTYFLPHFNLP